MSNGPDRRLLYFSPSGSGGLADYAHEQAQALGCLGIEVLFLTVPGYPSSKTGLYGIQHGLSRPRAHRLALPRLCRRAVFATEVLKNYIHLATVIRQRRFRYVLLGAYAEYLAPLWATLLRKLAQEEVVFGAVVHDPVRDYVVGPKWWHRRSVAAAYSFLHEAFVHEAIELDTVRPMPRMRTTVIPHGPYHFPPPQRSREQVRAGLRIPAEAKVLLAFGHVRDGKNLELAIRALTRESQTFLLVAGNVSSTSQKPVEYYQAIAGQVGAAPRCRWLTGFIPADQVGDLFQACDAVLLTYSAHFRSASGVLNAAVAYRRPCIASSGEGNLRSMVLRYGLGVFVEPDDCSAIGSGIRRWLDGIPEPRWEAYASDNSWETNARIVHERMWGVPA
jgi:glycosyltransferase involved in cell wall biosynthesis